MEPDQLLQRLFDDLTPFAAEHLGELVLAEDPWSFLEALAGSPQGALFALHWGGDDNLAAEHPQGAVCDNVIEIGVGLNPGLTKTRGKALIQSRPSDKPGLLKLVGLTRERVRSFLLPDDQTSERALRYQRTDPVVLPDGTPLMAYRLRFLVQASITMPEYRTA